MVVNVQTKEFYTNERKNELIESIEEKVSSEIDAVKPYKSEIMFQLKHLVYSSYEVGDDPNGAFLQNMMLLVQTRCLKVMITLLKRYNYKNIKR